MVRRHLRATRLVASALAALALGVLHPATPRGASPNIVISQVYGGGGNTGAIYTHDFIELFNRGNTAVSLAGWSLQYASASGTGSFGANSGQLTELPAVTLQPGQYFLVQQASGAAGTALPTPDLTDASPINMSGSSGKVALVSGSTSLGCNGGSSPCSAEQLARLIDLVGYGSANFSEGSAAAGLTNVTAAVRAAGGCTDSDDNSADFSAATPVPRTTATALNVCDGLPSLPSISIGDVVVTEGNAGAATAAFTVSLSSPAPADGVTFDISTTDGSATAASGDYVGATSTGQVIPEGSTTFVFQVMVNGDTTIETDETFTATISNVSGGAVSDASGTATIVNDDFLQAAIHTIQGAGSVSPLAGTPVVTTGLVTALKQNGFFIQSPSDAVDGDDNTSEGLFVFTATSPQVLARDLVRVTGTAGEFFDLTQIESVMPGQVTVLSSGHVLPAAVALTPAILDRRGTSQLEPLEGMRVAGALTSVAPTNDFGEIYAVLSGVARPRREPGIEAGLPQPPDPLTGLPDCCVPVWDRNPERIMVDTDGLLDSSAVWVTSNVMFAVDGPIDFTFGDYKVLPIAALAHSPNMTATAVPAPAPDEFTIAGYNIENFTGSTTQRRKAALHIRNVMRSPDVIGVVEIASKAALQALANHVNGDAIAAGEPNPQYVAELIPGAGGTQHVGFLVKASRVAIQHVTQERADETFTNPVNGLTELLHDRPPLVVDAVVNPASSSPARVIVVVNHLRSFIDIERLDGEGVRVRAKRKAQAEAIASLLQALQSANPATPVIAVGDYNAYEFSDGYTDPISIIKGRPTDGDEIVVEGSPDVVNPDFVNLTESLPQAERYSFIFEGTPQALDHVLVNRTAHAWLQRYAVARSNADFPSHRNAGYSGNASRPEAHSDHDSPVAYFRVPGRR